MVWLMIGLDFLRSESKGRSFPSKEYPRHPAVFVNAHSKGVAGVTVCKCRIQRSCARDDESGGKGAIR